MDAPDTLPPRTPTPAPKVRPIVLQVPTPTPEMARAVRWYVRLAELQYLVAVLALIPVVLGLLLVLGVVGLVLWLVLFG